MNRLPFTAPDRSRPLLPEDLPWLAHTDFWARFSDQERLRANQLMGLLVNELCLAVEHGLIGVGLRAALAAPVVRGDAAVHRRLERLFADELRHARWFAAYNRSFAPGLYGDSGFRFVAPGVWMRRLGSALARLPGAWRFNAWLVLATEEWSCGLAEALDREPIGMLGPRDEAFRNLHRAHLRDERRHVQLDTELIALSRRGIPAWLRPGLVRLAHAALMQFMRPRRAAPLMIGSFVDEFPRWRSEQATLIAAVREVGCRPDYWRRSAVGGAAALTAASAAAWNWSWPTPDEAVHG